MSILKGYYKEICKLKDEGYSSTKVQKWLKKNHGIDISARSIRDYFKRQGNNFVNGNTFEKQLQANNFKEDNWSYGWLKGKEGSVFIRNTDGEISLDEIRDEFISEIKDYTVEYPTIKRKKIKQGHTILIPLSDLHINKLSTKEETGEEYNSEIAVKRAIEGVEGLMQKAQGFPLDQIIFTIGGDILNTDGATTGTTRGTPQDTDLRWYEAFRTAKKAIVKIIEYLMQFADVQVVHIMSNHDYASGWMLSETLAAWFRNCKNVKFDNTVRHRKAYLFGDVAIFPTHGDKHKNADLPLLMAHEYPEIWAKAKYRYCFVQHFHHYKRTKAIEDGKDYIGLTVHQLASPSPADLWHANSGYIGAKQSIEAFIFGKQGEGRVSHMTHNF